MFRECEIKYKIQTQREWIKLKNILNKNGFIFISKQFESDFIPDVDGFLCRQNGILLRFRETKDLNIFQAKDILVTMKRKGEAKNFQEYYELEYTFSQFRQDIFNQMNEILNEITGITLPQNIHTINEFDKLIRFVKHLGFSQHRILLEKIREKYKGPEGIITFDYLPEGIGLYMEIETDSPEKLNDIIINFNLCKSNLETRDYGDLLKARKKKFPEIEKRTGFFQRFWRYDN